MNAVRSPVARTGNGSELAEKMPALSIPGFIRRPHRQAAVEPGLSIEVGKRLDTIGPVAASNVVDVAGGRNDVEGLCATLKRVSLLELFSPGVLLALVL